MLDHLIPLVATLTQKGNRVQGGSRRRPADSPVPRSVENERGAFRLMLMALRPQRIMKKFLDQNVTEPWSDMNFFFHIKGGELIFRLKPVS